jgi:hypothetical protein
MKRVRALTACALLGGGLAALAVHGAGCAQTPITVPVRSLEGSGKVSFVCLADPSDGPDVERDLSECTGVQFLSPNEYYYEDDAGDIDAGSGKIPHLYALVTQLNRGEVAVIDVSSANNSVLDQNPREPGANFLPVGAQPRGIVSTPGSVASFVGVAEIGRAGIFALPSSQIRPLYTAGTGGGAPDGSADQPVQQLSSWPACSLPSAPGDMILVSDQPNAVGEIRRSCDDPYEPVDPGERITTVEGQGRQKLIVAMPDLGGLIVVDADRLLKREPGSFSPCDVERWIPLEVDLTGYGGQPPPPTGAACVTPPALTPQLDHVPDARPSGLSYADGRLYVGDLEAPLIHVLDLPTPCDPVERPPLVPSSAEDPLRVVNAAHVAVAPLPTPDLKRYLYATDVKDSSIMVFDVSPSSTTRRPLERKHPEWNPFQPRDRIKYSAPPADILVVQRDVPEPNPATGIAQAGVRCSPDPNLLVCTATTTTCDPATLYRTSADFTSGAGPTKLRGEFAFVALKSGKLAVIDVDDFDAPCRVPTTPATLLGCPADVDELLASSTEVSCNVVEPNTPRSANYVLYSDQTGSHVPGVQNYPQLYGPDGTLVDFASNVPQMRATVPCDPATGVCTSGKSLFLFTNGTFTVIDPAKGQVIDSTTNAAQPLNLLAMNLEDPRAQIADQNWSVTFEGAIPGFEQRLAALKVDPGTSPALVVDPNSQFCTLGVLGEKAVREQLAAQGLTQKQIDERAPALADYVQITRDILDELDPHWSDPTRGTCEYQTCVQKFGPIGTPTVGRDLRILEAYQDHLEVELRNPEVADDVTVSFDDIRCCFPDALQFTVRGGNQWIVVGDQLGFTHHVVADAVTGACRNTCDPVAQRKNGRVIEVSNACAASGGACVASADCCSGVCTAGKCVGDAVADRAATALDPSPAFMNPMFRFSIHAGTDPTQRDMAFRFTTSGSFTPMLLALTADATQLIAPKSIAYIPSTSEIAITDGSFNGLIMVSLQSAAYSRSFF